MRVKLLGLASVVLLVATASACVNTASQPNGSSSSQSGVRVVAAENFYGDVARQLGGDHILLTTILSDPNADPHEYESTVQDSIAVSKAQVVIENGLGYDTWMEKLLAASPSSNRTVITAGDIATDILEDNPHVWYGVDNMPAIAQAIAAALKKYDPSNAAEYDSNLARFGGSLNNLRQKMSSIRNQYGGTPIGLTETIYLYQTQPMGLNVLTPLEFQESIAEGNDPPVGTVVAVNEQLNNRQIKVLIYNSQTVTPVTTNLQNKAKQLGIPIVPVSETMPKAKTYQTWMLDQLTNLEQGLHAVR